MTVHLFTPPTLAARRRVEALQFAAIDRRLAEARREETLQGIRAAIRPGVLRARRRHALRRWLSRAWAFVAARWSR